MNTLDVGYWILGIATAPIWARKKRTGWRERFGHDTLPAKARPRILLHAVSVGEVNALRALVPMLAQHAEVVVSTTTDTGLLRARDIFGWESARAGSDSRVHVVRYPLDFSSSVKRFLDAVDPDVVGLVELELWPNFIGELRKRGIPAAIINGRLSARSFKNYRRARPMLKRMFGTLDVAMVQDEVYADRFAAMGVDRAKVEVAGSMKWDAAAIADEVPGAEALAQNMGIDSARPVIVAGSTGPLASVGGEEALVHAATPQGVQLVCAPRKPSRFDEAAGAMPGCVRRSHTKEHGLPSYKAYQHRDRFLLDTIGELRQAYSLADVAVVGRSFGRLHGSDPIEPIALGKPTVIGPACSDFASIVRTLREFEGGSPLVSGKGKEDWFRGAIVQCSAEDLPRALAELMKNEGLRRELTRRGRACIRQQQGATKRQADRLLEMMNAGSTDSQ